MKSDSQWLEWVRELQFLSQSALAYCKDVYDIERFERIRAMSGEMLAALTDAPLPSVKRIFLNDAGFQTPKIETRAAVFQAGRILLVQESDGRWCLPGGWVDYNASIRENTVKEVLEEAGMTVRALRLIALQDRNRHHEMPTLHEICSVFVLCEYLSGNFIPNAETLACGWFMQDALPKLCEPKTTEDQIRLCFRAANDASWQVPFD